MKKAISVILVSILLCGLTLTVSANDDFSSNGDNSKVEELVNIGYPQSVIETLDSAAIDKIYQKVQSDNVVDIISDQETYYFEFPLDLQKQVKTRSVSSSSQIRITATAMSFTDSYGKITGCDVSINYDWLITPGICSNDRISLGWDPGLFTYTGYINGNNTVYNMGTGETDYYNFISSVASASNGFIEWYVDLMSPNMSPKVQANPGGSAYLSFLPAKIFYISSGYVSHFYIHYAHNKIGLPTNLSHRYVGIRVNCFGSTDTVSK